MRSDGSRGVEAVPFVFFDGLNDAFGGLDRGEPGARVDFGVAVSAHGVDEVIEFGAQGFFVDDGEFLDVDEVGVVEIGEVGPGGDLISDFVEGGDVAGAAEHEAALLGVVQ